MDLNFTAKVTDVNVDGLNKYLKAGAGTDVWPGKPEATVKYNLEPDVKDWGIRSIGINITSVVVDIEWECNEDELSESETDTLVAAGGTYFNNGKIEGTISVNSTVKFNYKDWEVKNEATFKEDGSLSLNEVSIDLIKNEITIS